MTLFQAWLRAFAITVLTELLVAVPVLGASEARSRRIAVVCLAQVTTHPAVWFLWPLYGWPRPLYLIAAEAFALITEALIYRLFFVRAGWSRALAAATFANGASILVGLWLR